jgi:hypothetical protein
LFTFLHLGEKLFDGVLRIAKDGMISYSYPTNTNSLGRNRRMVYQLNLTILVSHFLTFPNLSAILVYNYIARLSDTVKRKKEKKERSNRD